MHVLVPAVLLRTAGLNARDTDAPGAATPVGLVMAAFGKQRSGALGGRGAVKKVKDALTQVVIGRVQVHRRSEMVVALEA